MILKRILLIISIVAVVNISQAQNSVEIKYTDSSLLHLDKILLTNTTNIEDIFAAIGKADRVVDYKNIEKNYFYDSLGMIILTKDGKIKGLGINYNWDGDKKFPEKSFTGNLKIGELSISKNTKKDDIAAIKSLEFVCPIESICASKNREANVNSVISFTDNNITQIVFLIK
ncbi:MAG: hypothetical protein ABIP68_01720 [Ferruginibacter sp.]